MDRPSESSRYAGTRILYLALEGEVWNRSRRWSYAAQLGLEEGFQAAGVDWMTITTPCMRRARDLTAGQRFDQVWFHVVNSRWAETDYEWLASLAPVRLGLLAESLCYSAADCERYPDVVQRPREEFERWRRYLTHVAAFDERDADEATARGLSAMWYASAVPARCIAPLPPEAPEPCGCFTGTVYGQREDWLRHPGLVEVIRRQPSPEDGTRIPERFDRLQVNVQRILRRRWIPGAPLVTDAYLRQLRSLRREAFDRWLAMLRRGAAVVSLPALFSAYPGRVVEGMAAGRPVLAPLIKGRLRNRRLFRENEEILLFEPDDPEDLAVKLRRLIADPGLARAIAGRARETLAKHHTLEHRVCQVLDFLASGLEPQYR